MLNYEQAKARRDQIESVLSQAESIVASFPKSACGLHSDEVKSNPKFIKACQIGFEAFTALRAFNQVFVKKFKKEIALERKARRAELEKQNNEN